MSRCDVAIIGAGPYGLSAAAHLRAVPGLEVRVFGEPMSFWNCNMPAGMLLRSNWTATQIADPRRELTLEAYQAESGNHFTTPVPLERFVQYGMWYRCKAALNTDSRKVTCVEAHANGFRLMLQDGEPIVAHRVVVAVGIASFAWIPPEFQGLPSSVATHASAHRDFSPWVGKQVLVVGSGQSALESGALLHEAGADVEIVGRAREIHWLQGRLSRTLHHGLGELTRKLLYAPTDVGPAGLSQLMARPHLVQRLPRRLQDRLRKRCVRPAGARWLVKRLEEVPIRLGRSAVSVAPAGRRVKVTFDDGSERTVDHILLGTGYRVDIAKYEFLAPELQQQIDRFNGYPRLKDGLETTIPGLHVIGAPAAWSWGPLMQFVSGTHYASNALVRAISGQDK